MVEQRAGRLHEVHVTGGATGGFEEVLLEPSSPAVAERLAELAADGVVLEDGQRAEICLALDAWVRDVAGILGRGLLLVVDYGFAAADLYGPRHRAGTLVTYRGHAADGAPDAPYRDVGDRDVTAHVDMTTLQRRLATAGFDLLGETTQAEFLVGCGLEDILDRERARAQDAATWLLLRSAAGRLLDPRHLGGFRVVLAGRGIAPLPALRGLAFRLPGRRA